MILSFMNKNPDYQWSSGFSSRLKWKGTQVLNQLYLADLNLYGVPQLQIFLAVLLEAKL